MALEKQFNTFVKGMITEASPLTFPANASLDEDNCVLYNDGSRSRRLGVDYELNYNLINTGFTTNTMQRAKKSVHRWDSPGGVPTISIGIVRIYDRLWFCDLLSSTPTASLFNSGLPMILGGLSNANIEIAFINNYAVIVSSDLQSTIVLSYDSATNQIYQEETPFFIRDIWGVDDGLSPSERPSTLDDTHKYNLMNQGWSTNIKTVGITTTVAPDPTPAPAVTSGATMGYLYSKSTRNTGTSIGNYVTSWLKVPPKTITTYSSAIESTKTALGVYPSNSDVWTLGKTSDPSSANYQMYDANILAKNSYNNLYSPKASIVLDVYNRGNSRRSASGIQTLPLDKETGRCTTICSYASRLFYSGIQSTIVDADSLSPNYNSYIFFTQIITAKNKIPYCYQEADPTSYDISDIVDTDGGTIQIPEATNIVKLIPAMGSLLVCAENGIWEVYGDTGGFKATSFQVSKVTSQGIAGINTAVEVNGTVLMWAKAGIFTLTVDNISGRFKAENVSLNTIQEYYNDIPELAKINAKVVYNQKENIVRWLYNDTSTYSQATGLSSYNKELILDLTLKAFYPTTIALADNVPSCSAYIDMPGFSVAYVADTIVVGNDTVVDTALDTVEILVADYTSQQASFKFLVTYGSYFTFASYRDETFYDWKSQTFTGVDYSSFLVTGYDIQQDLMRNKQVPYIFCYFTKTEDGFALNNQSNLDYTSKSGCLLQAQWNWTNTASGNKWGTPFQAYRFTRNYTPSDSTDNFDNGDHVIVTRNKLRGSGRSLSLKFQSEAGKDMKILGWAYPITGDKVV